MLKNKFDPNTAFKKIINVKKEDTEESNNKKESISAQKKDRVQKSYYLDKDLFKALQLKSFQEEINLTEAINSALREGLKEYLENLDK